MWGKVDMSLQIFPFYFREHDFVDPDINNPPGIPGVRILKQHRTHVPKHNAIYRDGSVSKCRKHLRSKDLIKMLGNKWGVQFLAAEDRKTYLRSITQTPLG